jgi:hypothetical protein
MKCVLWSLSAILLLSVTARAQSVPEWEIAGGYSYLRADIGGASFAMNGGTGSATQNMSRWFGGRLEFYAYDGTLAGKKVLAQTYTYGPVFSYRRHDKWTPFGQVQIGAIHANTGYLGISQSAFKFAMAPGAGVDFAINERTAIRVQADYLMTFFLGLRQDNVRGSAGIVIRLGRRE